nr:hypothetical protein CFP56_61892 [Quercus suber]
MNTATVSSSIFSKPSTPSFLRLNSFMSKLQYRGLQQTPRTHLPCSSFGISNGNGYRKCSQLKCSKVKFHPA